MWNKTLQKLMSASIQNYKIMTHFQTYSFNMSTRLIRQVVEFFQGNVLSGFHYIFWCKLQIVVSHDGVWTTLAILLWPEDYYTMVQYSEKIMKSCKSLLVDTSSFLQMCHTVQVWCLHNQLFFSHSGLCHLGSTGCELTSVGQHFGATSVPSHIPNSWIHCPAVFPPTKVT